MYFTLLYFFPFHETKLMTILIEYILQYVFNQNTVLFLHLENISNFNLYGVMISSACMALSPPPPQKKEKIES